jgi:3-dehydroquinate dehydratase II
MMTAKLLVLNGPNLNLLGEREPEIYGTTTLADIEALCAKTAQTHGLTVDFRQSNHEGVLIDWVHEVRHTHAGIIINAGAYTHTSVALHDALKAVTIPIIEVHLSDPKTREPFRHHSYIEPLAKQSICGKGAHGYALAVEALAALLKK